MTGLVKLARKRDASVPVGQAAPLYLDCPCGLRIWIPFTVQPARQVVTCEYGCGARYTGEDGG